MTPADHAAVADLLRRAKEWIGTPERWNGDRVLRNAAGKRVGLYSKDAVAWNGVAAVLLSKLHDDICDLRAIRALDDAVPTNHQFWEWETLPTTTHADVMAAFDRAIEAEDKAAAEAGR